MLAIKLIIFIVIFVHISASPKRYSNAQKSQFDGDLYRLSDIGTHPHMKENFQSQKRLSGKSMAENPELTKEYWIGNAKTFVERQIAKKVNRKKAKNIILFLGDGMGHTSITAARVVLGGEEKKLAFENFPHVASAKTYCVNVQVPDSACTITSLLHGVKTNRGTIGINANASRYSCDDHRMPSKFTNSIAKWFLDDDRSVGVVTTTRVTHATPAGVYAHTTERDWEGNAEVASSGCNDLLVDDVAEQLIYGKIGKKLKVVLGGGSSFFVNTSTVEHGAFGKRTDGKNLMSEWLKGKSGRKLVRNREELMKVDSEEVGQLLGLFSSSHMPFQLEVEENQQQSIYPTLSEMTVKAIDVLSENDDGYFLLVEGGRIDQGHHYAQARLAIGETVEFHRAVEAAVEKVNLEETLIIVTGDHSHPMTIGGYSLRGNDIFGPANFHSEAKDGMPYFTISYANGPGYPIHRSPSNNSRVDPTHLDSSSLHFRFPATVPMVETTHSGEDVGLWAIGPNAHLFKGVIEQSTVAHVMAYASCVGNGLAACDNFH